MKAYKKFRNDGKVFDINDDGIVFIENQDGKVIREPMESITQSRREDFNSDEDFLEEVFNDTMIRGDIVLYDLESFKKYFNSN